MMLSGTVMLLCCVAVMTADDSYDSSDWTGAGNLVTFATYTDPKEQGVVTVRRFGLQQGFHRTLVTEVVIGELAYRAAIPHRCHMLLKEQIPSGMYVDLDQINIERHHNSPEVLSEKPIDTEKPEYLSEQHTLYVFHPLKAAGTGLGNTAMLPVHLRYHRPSPGADPAIVELPAPQLLVRCPDSEFYSWVGNRIKAPCDASNMTICAWTMFSLKQDAKPLRFHVPVGNQDDSTIVLAITLGVTAGAVISLFVCFLSRANSHSTLVTNKGEDLIQERGPLHSKSSPEFEKGDKGPDSRKTAGKARLRKVKTSHSE